MGGLLSRLRAKPSTKELLEDLEKDIEHLEEYKRSTEQQHKRVVGSFIFYFMLMFIVAAGVFLVYYFPHLNSTKEKLIYSIPLWIVPVVCFLIKKFLHWYFIQKIKYNDENLTQLRRRRRSLLEYAMETETYKVVKELLEKYDPEYHKKVFETRAIEAPPPSMPLRGNFAGMEVRKRASPVKTSALPHIAPGQTITLNTGAGPPSSYSPLLGKPNSPSFPPPYLLRNNPPFVRSPVPQQMPRPVLPRERTVIDRIVDYMVGDGPSNRYALICRQCQSHNGMALREEFEFIAFRCCYCFHWNPPRTQKQITQAPSSQDEHSSPLALPDAGSSSPLVTEPHSGSDGSCSSGEEHDAENTPEKTKVLGRKSSKAGSESPSVRRRLNLSSDQEIHARLEEDKPIHLHAELD